MDAIYELQWIIEWDDHHNFVHGEEVGQFTGQTYHYSAFVPVLREAVKQAATTSRSVGKLSPIGR